MTSKEKKAAHHAQYMKTRYHSDPEFRERIKGFTATNKRKRIERNKSIVKEFKVGGCCLCGELDSSCLLSHHIDPSAKEFGIASLTSNATSETKLRKELAKCVCLCLNCHAKVHYGKH